MWMKELYGVSEGMPARLIVLPDGADHSIRQLTLLFFPQQQYTAQKGEKGGPCLCFESVFAEKGA